MEMTQVRYGRKENQNELNRVLYTVKEGESIYFGIARCNVTKGDKFEKARGRQIAEARALKAKSETPEELKDIKISESPFFHPYGKVPVSEVKDLLQYFRGLDEYRPFEEDVKKS